MRILCWVASNTSYHTVVLPVAMQRTDFPSEVNVSFFESATFDEPPPLRDVTTAGRACDANPEALARRAPFLPTMKAWFRAEGAWAMTGNVIGSASDVGLRGDLNDICPSRWLAWPLAVVLFVSKRDDG